MNYPKFHIELVPKTSWFSNVRSQVSQEDWDWLRKETYKQAGHKCEGCSAKGKMEAHEIWHYDDKKSIQKLHSIVCVCNLCHLSYHIGYAQTIGKGNDVIKHLMKINKWTRPETDLYLEGVFEVWYQRSQKSWHLDLSLLDSCNIKYSLINKKDRAKFSAKNLK